MNYKDQVRILEKEAEELREENEALKTYLLKEKIALWFLVGIDFISFFIKHIRG